ncbi:conserved hypothetical protein [Klebsiella variicola]|nr:conserved hypothetical protein [Klebsiella variicola]
MIWGFVVILLILDDFIGFYLARPRCSYRDKLKTVASIDYYIYPRHDQKRMRFIFV